MDSDSKVSFREVVVIRTERDRVIIRDGIIEGERIATTPIPNVINGMEVNVRKSSGSATIGDLIQKDKN